jgi:integrase/recombinase XerC
MASELDTIRQNPTLEVAQTSAADLMSAWLAGRKPTTMAAYRKDLEAFTSWLGLDDDRAALEHLMGHGNGHANMTAHNWRASMLDAGLTPATVNRRLSALRSVVKMANRVGMVEWTLSVEGVKSTPYRDTRGPGVGTIREMLAACNRKTEKGRRDYALLRLMFDRGLRRGEVIGLDLDHVDLDAGTVAVQAKGKLERDLLTVNDATVDALRAVIEDATDDQTALFVSLHRAGTRGRLTGRDVHRVVDRLGKAAGVAGVRPHGLRHSAVTAVLDATNGNVREARAFSRHAKLETVALYDDARNDVGGELSTRLGDLIGTV